MHDSVIDVRGLSIDYRIGQKWLTALSDIDISIEPRQIHGLVGESGSGKSTLGLAMMRYLAENARVSAGEIHFGDTEITKVGPRDIARIWGAEISLVPQSPMDSLNPSLRLAKQMIEPTMLHLGLGKTEARDRAIEALRQVQISDPGRVIDRYPHQLSGGMLQRVMIALALSTRPQLLILDEPTTALDVTTQAVILDLLKDLITRERAAALYVSHDLATVAQLCRHVTVLYAGEVMESAPVRQLFAEPCHPYTAGLLACLPSATTDTESRLQAIRGVAPSLAERSSACVFADRCPVATDQCRNEKPPLEQRPNGALVRCWRWREIESGALIPTRQTTERRSGTAPTEGTVLRARGVAKRFVEGGFLRRALRRPAEGVQALNDLSVSVRSRSTFGVVGESGSGKTTLARSLLALTEPDAGSMHLAEKAISLRLSERDRETLQNLRIVFQNPDDSLNPYRTVGEAVGRAFAKLSEGRPSRAETRARVEELLAGVGLSADYYGRRPTMLSGGEKQRVAIARAFASHPAVVVADEPTSALDVSVQAVVLNLLKDLRAEEGVSYVLISHDLEVVGYLADYIAVMYLGEIVEQGENRAVLDFPSHPYTEALLSAAPVPDPTVQPRIIELTGEIPSPRNRPSGCPFHTRCPRKIGTICETQSPPVRVSDNGHEIRCHYEPDELRRLQTGTEEPT